MGGRERAQVAVREGKDHDVPRRLLEVDGLLALVEGDLCDRKKVHVIPPRRAASTALRSKPFRPITTMRPSRASPAFQGRSK